MNAVQLYQLMQFLCKHEIAGDVLWHASEDGVRCLINCSDLFGWGTADGESITPDDIDDIERAIADCAEHGECSEATALELYVARKRQMRPQGAAYADNRHLWPLFDACGPERAVGRGNPYTPEEGLRRRQKRRSD